MNDELLFTISQVAVTLAGFSGVIFALGNRSRGRLSSKEESGLSHMLLTSFGPVIISLMAGVLLESELADETAWRIGCAIAGIFAFTGSTKAMLDEIKGKHSLPKIIAWIAPIGAQVLGAFNLLAAIGPLKEYATVLFQSLLIYLIWISMTYFVSLLKQEQANE